MTASSDPRGGLFIDHGDGRGPIHIDDLADAERAALLAPDAPPAVPPVTTEDETDAR